MPVVLAGNVKVRDEVAALLRDAGVPVTPTENVLPRIGELRPQPARAAIREVFLRHVIGGKRLSRGPRFARLVRAATPDAVLTAVELLADAVGRDLLVLDVGGATTDVYSALLPDAERATGPRREVAGTLWRSRTVEGDLGVRWNAPGVVAAARAERLLDGDDALDAAARLRAENPGLLAGDPDGAAVDLRLARLAATVALRRHARRERDLRDVVLVVGSGGVLRHATPGEARRVLETAVDDRAGGWSLPRHPACRVDHDCVLAAAGVLAANHPDAALALLRQTIHPS